MYKVKDIQNYTNMTNKPMLYTITGFALVLMLPFSYVFAVPPDPGYGSSPTKCDDMESIERGDGKHTCCWLEAPPATDPTATFYHYCQTCTSPDGNSLECDQKELQLMTKPPTTEDSIFPSEDGKAVDDQQPMPRSPLTDQRVLPNNEAVVEQPKTSNEGNNLNNLGNKGGGVLEQPSSDEETSSRIVVSPTGGCQPTPKDRCLPCDPGLSGSYCMLASDWETATQDQGSEGLPQKQSPTGPLTEETIPKDKLANTKQLTQSTQELLPSCPQDQTLDEKSKTCVSKEQSTTDDEPEAAEDVESTEDQSSND